MAGLIALVGAGLATALASVAVGLVAWAWVGADRSNVGELSFANPLAIPPLSEGRLDADGTRVHDLSLQAGTTAFRPGPATPTWGVNGSYLGPTLRVGRGEAVRMEVANRLPEPTTLHWHGMRVPARMDGGPHQVVAPGATWSPTWVVDQPASTLWYHPHLHGETAEHVRRGVAGMIIVEDEASAALGLPHRYGVDDVPVIVQDRSFDGDGSFSSGGGFLSTVGDLGDEILVNGTHDPHLVVTTEAVRLRLLNASGARVYDFGFADGRSFAVVGSDGGLLPAPVSTDRVQLSPGERAEVVVRLAPGERAVLRSFPPDLGWGLPMARFNGGDDTFDVLALDAAPQLTPSPPLPAALVPVERLDPGEARATARFVLEGQGQIDGRSMDPARIDHVATTGTVEVWEVENGSGTPHNFHVHDVQFQVLSLSGSAPPPELAGWKDTVFLPPGEEVRLVMRFGTSSDPEVPYMFHCHLLAHEDRGMMGQFVVVAPGEEPSSDRLDLSGAGHQHHH